MFVKICGLRRIDDILYANELKPDFIGFVFASKSKRRIDYDKALKLKEKLDKSIKVVGVYLNQDIDFILEAVKSKIIYIIQLHGNEDDNYIKELKEKSGLPIINVYRESEYADYVMYDSVSPGMGIKPEYNYKKGDKPIFLAGGINILNIDEIKKLNPYCVDTSSGVEVDDYKDYDKMKEFIRKARL